MRIVGGQFRGRALATPGDDRTRPTSDRVREAVFNILAHGIAGFSLEGVRVLDLFAGTGALGVEALSRGAAYCLFVEEDADARGTIRRNVEAFGLTGVTKIFRRDATALGPAENRGTFGLVFLDPPMAKASPSARWPPPRPARGWRQTPSRSSRSTRAQPSHFPQASRHWMRVRGAIRRSCSRAIQASPPEPNPLNECPFQEALPRRIDPSSSGFAKTCGWPTIARSRQPLRPANRVLAIYVFDEDSPGIRPLGGASRWWLHHSLAALTADLAKLGTALHIYRGAAGALVPKLAKAASATGVFWSRRYGAAERAVDTAVKSALHDAGIEAESCNDHLLIEPWEVKTKAGEPFKVFTPFWRTARALGDPPAPIGRAKALSAAEPPPSPKPITFDSWRLLPTKPDWAGGLRETWTPGEAGARKQLSLFIAKRLPSYAAGRDRPDLAVTSAPVAASAFRRDQPAPGLARGCPCRGRWQRPARRCREVSVRDRLARVLLSPAVPQSRSRHRQLRRSLRRLPLGEGHQGAPRLAARPHRLPHRRCRHARALAHRRHAQPRAHDRGLVPDQASADRLAPGRALVLGYAGGRRSRQQSGELAMGGGLRRRCRALLPHLQSRAAGRPSSIPREPTYAAGCRNWRNSHTSTSTSPGTRQPPCWKRPASTLGRDYPHPIVALDEGRGRALAAFDRIKR